MVVCIGGAFVYVCVWGVEGGNLGRLKVFVLGLGRWESFILCWLLGWRGKNVGKSLKIAAPHQSRLNDEGNLRKSKVCERSRNNY